MLWAIPSIWRPLWPFARSTTFGWSRITAMPWAAAIMPRALAQSLGFTENSPGLDEGPDRGADRHLGRYQHPELLSTPSPHDGGGRCGEYRVRSEAEGGLLSRLGSRLLVPAASTTPATNASAGSLVNYPRGTTTSTPIAISATTSSPWTRRRQ